MTQDAALTIRLPQELLDRAERLIPLLESHGPLAATRVSKAVVIRLALMRGLDELERDVRGQKSR